MKKYLFSILVSIFIVLSSFGQDTFSIVAVDEATGEVGSAGASCVVGAADLGGVILISGIIPGRGAINGQATVCIPHVNLNNGIDQMENGLAPQEILDWLFDNDACAFGGNQNRQYGIVDFDDMGMARSAAFTGNQALDYAGQRVGPNYSIQGNILLGPEILDSMEARFLNSPGPLAKKLMAALQGANVPGADSRCLNAGTSSTSAFLQVYKSDDLPNNPWLRINVMETETGVEPIDSVQVIFDAWCATVGIDVIEDVRINVYPNPANDIINIETPGLDSYELLLFDLDGKTILNQKIIDTYTLIFTSSLKRKGIVIYQVRDEENIIRKVGKLFVN
jgi:uncharacterized Ntn-hydrolase superfamily protein